jgi:hypothetical protein
MILHLLPRFARTISQRGGLRYLARLPARIFLSARFRLGMATAYALEQLQHMLKSLHQMLQLEENPNPLLVPHIQLLKLVSKLVEDRRASIGMATIGEVWRYAPPAPPDVNVLNMPDPGASDESHEFNVRVPPVRDQTTAKTLVVCASIDFLFRWDRLEEDLERFLADGRERVIIIFIVPEFRRVDIASHSYLLSILASSIPVRKFVAKLELYVAPEDCTPERPLVRSVRLLAASIWQAVRRSYLGLLLAGGIEAPTKISALVISVTSSKPPMKKIRQ